MRARRIRRVLLSLALVVASILAAAFVTGKVAIVVTHGVSMLPSFHTGDLVLVVSSASYHIGEVVAYHSPMLHTTVLHRIVAEHDGLFTFKGDHNTWLDPQQLGSSAIAGAMLVHLPRVGLLLGWLRSPHAGVVVALLVALSGLGGLSRRRPASNRRRRAETRGAPQVRTRSWEVVAAALCVALFARSPSPPTGCRCRAPRWSRSPTASRSASATAALRRKVRSTRPVRSPPASRSS